MLDFIDDVQNRNMVLMRTIYVFVKQTLFTMETRLFLGVTLLKHILVNQEGNLHRPNTSLFTI